MSIYIHNVHTFNILYIMQFFQSTLSVGIAVMRSWLRQSQLEKYENSVGCLTI